jgi:DNA-binding CsgD family transcriptional regulator
MRPLPPLATIAALAVRGHDYLSIIEAAYRSPASDDAWLTGIFEASAPILELGRGVVALQYQVTADGSVDLRNLAATPTMRLIEPDSRDYLDRTRGPMLARMFCRTDAMFLRRDAAGRPETYPDDFRYWQARGVEEAFSVVGYDPSGQGVMLTAMASPEARVAPKKRALLRCIAAHLASAVRLRSLRPGLPGAGGGADARDEAVVTTDGEVVDAAAPADAPAARRLLAEAGRSIGRARSRTLGDEEAVRVWRALWAGRWTLVDREERGGRCYLVARKNDPQLAEPRALLPRERQVLAYAQLGHSQKFIGFELGLSPSTVAGHLASGLRKLGLDDRTQLAQLPDMLRPSVAE